MSTNVLYFRNTADDDDGNNDGGGVFQWRRRWTTARRWGQKEMQQSNRLQRRQQGEVKGIGGAHLGVGGTLSGLSSGGSEEDGSGRGGSAPDDGAGVVGVYHLP